MSQFSLIRVHPYQFLLHITQLQEVIPFPEVDPVPQAPDYILGVFPLRGTIYTLLSLPSLMGFSAEPQKNCQVVIVEHPLGKFGLPTHRVDLCHFSTPPAPAPDNLPFREWIEGVYSLEDGAADAFVLNLRPLHDHIS